MQYIIRDGAIIARTDGGAEVAQRMATLGDAIVLDESSSRDATDISGLYFDGNGIAVRPAKPGASHRWDVALKAWSFPIDLAKDTKNTEINTARLTANRSTFIFAGKDIACDELSRSDIDGAHGIILMTGALPPGWPGGWKAVDNTSVPIPDVATWGAFYAAMVSQGMSNFAKSQVLKAQLASATTIAEVVAIQW